MKIRFLAISALFMPLATQTAASSKNEPFTVRSLSSEPQSVICLHQPHKKACVIGIISGPDQKKCKEVVRQMWEDHNKNEFCLKTDHEKNAEQFCLLYQTAKLKLRDKQKKDRALELIYRDLPTRLSWLSISYADALQYIAYVYSSHPQRERDIEAYKVHDITAKSISRPPNAVVFNADSKIIQFDIPHIEKPKTSREDEGSESWMCAIQ